MIRTLKLVNFKRFEFLEMQGLKGVNLIAGVNNSGKTGVLEALALAATQDTPESISRWFRRPDLQKFAADKWFFRNGEVPWAVFADGFEVKPRIRVPTRDGRAISDVPFKELMLSPSNFRTAWSGAGSAVTAQDTPGDLTLSLVAVPIWPDTGYSEAEHFDRLVSVDREEEKFEKLLRAVEPKLKTARNIGVEGGQRLLHASIEGIPTRMPLSLLGHGVTRVASIFIRALGANAKLLLLDEMEAGLHYSALKDVWRGLKALHESEGTQIFATTHSMDCIEAALEVFGSEASSALAFHRLEDVDGKPACVSMDAERLASALASGFEMR
jgi:AAA15 family ATPase/GTPase